LVSTEFEDRGIGERVCTFVCIFTLQHTGFWIIWTS